MRIGRIQNDKLKMRNPPKLEKQKLYKVLEKGCPHCESEYAIPPKAPITKKQRQDPDINEMKGCELVARNPCT